MSLPAYINDIKSFLTEQGVSSNIDSVIILGSGLGSFTEHIENKTVISYNTIPHFPETSVQGHSGELILGTVDDKSVLAFSGRFHHYEGHEFQTTVLPVHIAKSLRAKKLIVSNAAGAINQSFAVGDLMVIEDIFRPFHPIESKFHQNRYRYNLYPIATKVRKLSARIGLDVQRGTYLYMKGPNYETKAEIRAFRRLGADVVGMSTAPELAEASRLKIKAAAVSMVTNMAAGVLKQKLDHSEVKIAAESRKEDFSKLVREIIKQL